MPRTDRGSVERRILHGSTARTFLHQPSDELVERALGGEFGPNVRLEMLAAMGGSALATDQGADTTYDPLADVGRWASAFFRQIQDLDPDCQRLIENNIWELF